MQFLFWDKWVFFIGATAIFEILRYAITIYVFWIVPLQFFSSSNRAILYVFDALGPTRRPVYFRMVQNMHDMFDDRFSRIEIYLGMKCNDPARENG